MFPQQRNSKSGSCSIDKYFLKSKYLYCVSALCVSRFVVGDVINVPKSDFSRWSIVEKRT